MMGIVLPIAGALAVGIMLGLGLTRLLRTVRQQGKQSKYREQGGAAERAAKPETMKRVVWVCVINGFAWVWCSYILAALDRAQIAEELSKVALAEIIVPIAIYAFKSAVENLSKNNRWPDKGGREPPGTG